MTDTPTMIDIDEAREIVVRHARALPRPSPERVPLSNGLGRILAEDVVSDIDFPPFDRATMDGYAVRSDETQNAPVTLPIAGSIPAGASPGALPVGSVMQINTGAALPAGADAVVRVEDTDLVEGDRVCVRRSVVPGTFVADRASIIAKGGLVLGAGTRLGPRELAAAATAGAGELVVSAWPTASMLVTGDELVDVSQRPTGSQIRNSNGILMESYFRVSGARVRDLGVVGDDVGLLGARIAEGMEASVFCVTGGISMGAYDHVPEVLRSRGGVFRIHKLAIKPGRPTIFATGPRGGLVFALPGNPGSALIGLELLVRPALRVLAGVPVGRPAYERVRLDGALPACGGRRSFRPARLSVTAEGVVSAAPLSWQGSGDAQGLATADALLMQPPQSPALSRGESVMILRLADG